MTLWHKLFTDQLNIVVIRKTKLEVWEASTYHTFLTDLKLSYEKIIDYYCLRFQIEFNFRDAKQFWGLEDFMNVKQKRIHNFTNLSMLMV